MRGEYYAQEQDTRRLIIDGVNGVCKYIYFNDAFCKRTWPESHILYELTRRNGNLATVACQHDALTSREAGAALFLYNHDGAAVVFTDFQLHTLGFVHRTLNALACYATCHGT